MQYLVSADEEAQEEEGEEEAFYAIDFRREDFANFLKSAASLTLLENVFEKTSQDGSDAEQESAFYLSAVVEKDFSSALAAGEHSGGEK